MAVPQFKEIRRAYGFEEVAIVPGDVTINPDQTNTELTLGSLHFNIPILAAAMDAVVSPDFAVRMSQAGGLGVMNLEGLQTRYENPQDELEKIANAPKDGATEILQRIYSAPMKEALIGRRVEKIKKAGGTCAVSITPQNAKR
ncbi:MAG: guanosine monophosphate reductase, partial [SAR202 cluster bacterium Io17-Chloro-G3]